MCITNMQRPYVWNEVTPGSNLNLNSVTITFTTTNTSLSVGGEYKQSKDVYDNFKKEYLDFIAKLQDPNDTEAQQQAKEFIQGYLKFAEDFFDSYGK